MAVFKIGRETKSSDDAMVIGDWLKEFVAAGGASDRKWMESRGRDMSQAITKILHGEGTPTSEPTYHQRPVLHASAGVAARTGNISIFYVVGTSPTAAIRILGIGEHTTSTTYRLRWKDKAWQKEGLKVEL